MQMLNSEGVNPKPFDSEAIEQSPVGLRFDDGKRRVDLVPPSLINGVADILTYGAKKYSDRNWEKGIAFSRCYGSLMRHLLAWWGGEDIDPESGLPHMHHVGCNVAFLIELIQTHPELDDRP